MSDELISIRQAAERGIITSLGDLDEKRWRQYVGPH